MKCTYSWVTHVGNQMLLDNITRINIMGTFFMCVVFTEVLSLYILKTVGAIKKLNNHSILHKNICKYRSYFNSEA